MKKFLIEREIPKVGSLNETQMREAAARSNQVLKALGPEVQWVQSYVTADKLFCVYLAKDARLVQEHASLSGFPATRITEIGAVIDPATGA
jgi:hypothetical protein